ncbi:cytochrome P450 [Blastococcus sp. CT_GayMR19]|uniref:cytochrome P450 family protein n=1 Tax=Blastococcus sp. CT_GayMR19 TaxID=2559608 RepID=UPI00107331E2|nr:cytochrome P450 [Blastococcus sp. CT_GayMR19]TFV79117.1 cytochrome P450 [Blastococcus sp. CT_GayMR19]
MTVPATPLVDPAVLADPHPVLAELRESGPVHRIDGSGGLPVWMVTRYDDVLAALSDPRLSNDPHHARALTQVLRGDFLSRSMIGTDPPEHTRLRRLVSKAFTARRVEGLRPRVQEITDALLDRITPRGSADLVAEFGLPLPITVIGELLGVPEADRDRFREWTDEMLDRPFDPGSDLALVEAARERMRGYLADLVAAKRARPADDLLTDLVEATDEGERLDAQELLAMTFLLLIAGYVTTVSLIGNGTLALLRHPDQLDRLRADPSLVPAAVEELLRFDGPVNPGLTRFALEDLEIGGVRIPRGDMVLLSIAAADRDPRRFSDPDRLDVGAQAPGHLAFGHGMHYCLGAPLARLEGQIAFPALLTRLPGLALAAQEVELRWTGGGVFRSLRALPVTFIPTPARVD